MNPTRPCDHCGMALYGDDAYCPGCGNPAHATATPPADPGRRSARISLAIGTGAHAFLGACGRCGSEVLPGDAFCQLCGARQPRS